ncbi:MAG: M42 family metallopeptidase [Candidatus Heimdallarchaeota archaeon]|nr:M42 family metallopeptidase [Candidatus Heimdallarchaeota archaeon]
MHLDKLEQWSNAFGPSGFEHEVGQLIHSYVCEFAEEVTNDKTGSIIFKKGNSGPKIMIPGHMDEVGFIITSIDKSGYLSFNQLGGWWDQTLLNQRVIIRSNKGEKITGVIAAKPPHLLEASDRTKVVTKSEMFIDVGCKSDEEVKKLGIRVGDPAVPDSTFEILKRFQMVDDKEKEVQLAMGKAFDDRIGVFIATEVMRRIIDEKIEHPNIIYGVSTTQEEVGLRGAKTAAQVIQPDLAIVLEVDIAGDVPGVDKKKAPAEMSKGPSILVADGSMLPNPKFRDYVINLAEELKIDHQLSFVFGGGTDGGVIHTTGSGAPSIVISIATRHIHSHNGILDLGDVDKTITLIVELLRRLDDNTVKSFTSY